MLEFRTCGIADRRNGGPFIFSLRAAIPTILKGCHSDIVFNGRNVGPSEWRAVGMADRRNGDPAP